MHHDLHRRIGPILCAALAATGCGSGGDTALLAQAEEYELTVNEAVRLLAAAPDLPNEPIVAASLGELWVDYILLGEVARRDTAMEAVDVEPLVRQQVERQLILTLRDSVIEADTAVSETELRTLFEEERPGVSVEARHILLAVPEDATDLQQDSIRRLASRVREQAVSGAETFDDLAREYSQDAGSAQQGGRLGLVERGQSVPAIDEVLFALEPGEISDLVETSYGLHVFRVDERHEPGFDEISEYFRGQVQQRRHVQAESTYIAAMLDSASVQPVDEAADFTRRMADRPGTNLTRRAARRPVVTYDGGELTLQEVLEFMQTSTPDFRGRIVQAPDEVVEDEVLLSLVQRELLLRRAQARDYTVGTGVRDSLTALARERFVATARQVGVLRVTPAPGQSDREALEARVSSILREIVSNNRDVIPLGAITFALRKQFPSRVFETGVDRVVQRLAEVRGDPGGGGPSEGLIGAPVPEEPPLPTDTSSGG